MHTFRLSPDVELLHQEFLLVPAWKKAHDYIRRHNWYSDVLELDLTNADLERRLQEIGDEIRTNRELRSDPLRLVLAPKTQPWELKRKDWTPTNGAESVAKRLRPLAHVSARDQIISTAFMILLADKVETRQGDPRSSAANARKHRMVSYGHRLFCDADDGQLRYRWGNAVVYRQYFQDYQKFLSRPHEMIRDVFGDKTDWAIVSADLSQFYDRIRPDELTRKINAIVGMDVDRNFIDRFRSFFRWRWHDNDRDEALKYADIADPPIHGFDDVALPQGLVASGFFANAYLLDFDDAVCRGFDEWHDENRWQMVDFCRYVDDMRVVIRLGEGLRESSEEEISELVSSHLLRLLETNAEGLVLNPKKSQVVLGRDAAAGSILVSGTMKRINHNASGVMDLLVGEETLDLIEGLFSLRQDDPLTFEDRFHDAFFAAKPDVRDTTIARFAANRFRSTYRSIRPLCEDDATTSDESLLPVLSRTLLDNKAAHFSRRMIERWVRDPSNMRLLRVALDVFPDVKSLDVVLDLLRQYLDVDGRRGSPRRVAWYCAAELLKAGATETGLVSDSDYLPGGVNLAQYQEALAGLAEQIVSRRNTYPWYVEQQALLFLACVGRHQDRQSTNPYVSEYLRLHQVLSGNLSRVRQEDVVPFVLVLARLRSHQEAARTFLSRFRLADSASQRKWLLRVIQESAELAEEIDREMSPEERETWQHLFRSHGFGVQGGFPDNIESLPVTASSYSLLSVARSAVNPFRQEYAALHLARALLRQLTNKTGVVFPACIRVHARDWRALCSDRFPINVDNVSVEFTDGTDVDSRFILPHWLESGGEWKYQLGQILRVCLTGVSDFTRPANQFGHGRVKHVYSPYCSSWLRRRYGLFNGRNAFGPPWIPISSWLGTLLSRLLEWPGYARFDLDFELPDNFDADRLDGLLRDRIAFLERIYGRASCTPILSVRTPKEFMRPRHVTRPHSTPSAPTKLRVGVVQTVIPRCDAFTNDPELNVQSTRRLHRRHLSAVLGGVHRMLQVRESHRDDGSGIELLVLPELAVHPKDIATHIKPFVLQHRCIVFAGIVFHPQTLGSSTLINTGLWVIPVNTPRGGLHITSVAQGKWNLTEEEKQMGISPFRPCQWLLELVEPKTNAKLWTMSGAICYDSTDLCLAADLRSLTDMFVIPALNKDVATFDNLAAALHYHMYQHVIIANCGQFGGSTGRAPFEDRHRRMLFHAHGNEQVAISFFEIELDTYRNGSLPLKTPPAGYMQR